MEIRDYTNQEFIPTHFLTVYCRNSNSHQEKYLEVGDIINKGKKYHVGASRPADMDFLTDLVQAIKVDNFKALKFKGLLPNNVLFSHAENENPTLIWYRIPEKRYLHFAKDMSIESAEYQTPPVLFVLNDGELFVYRLIDFEITNETKLYKLPLPNIHEGSDVCLGNNEHKFKKAKCLEDIIKLYEDLFYKTRFNALHDESFFDEGVIYIDVLKNKNISSYPLKQAKVKTIKNLLHDLS